MFRFLYGQLLRDPILAQPGGPRLGLGLVHCHFTIAAAFAISLFQKRVE